jgi:hypothetical protein
MKTLITIFTLFLLTCSCEENPRGAKQTGSDQSIQIEYKGEKLLSEMENERAVFRVGTGSYSFESQLHKGNVL